MEENVALDSNKQKKFVKSIKGIKKLIKKNESKGTPDTVIPAKPKEASKRKRKERGLVYLSHIPHGFYENEMTQYFKQFGVVTNVRVIRSKKTGNSKGHAFVEFKETSVAQIVADTMNNYLMGKRLIKAAYIPPEEQRHNAFRKHWSSTNNPAQQKRLKMKKAYNSVKDEAEDMKRARKLLSNLSKTKKKLAELGINYDFFAPVDVPETLNNTQINIKPAIKEETKIEVKNPIEVKTKRVLKETNIKELVKKEKKVVKAKVEKGAKVKRFKLKIK